MPKKPVSNEQELPGIDEVSKRLFMTERSEHTTTRTIDIHDGEVKETISDHKAKAKESHFEEIVSKRKTRGLILERNLQSPEALNLNPMPESPKQAVRQTAHYLEKNISSKVNEFYAVTAAQDIVRQANSDELRLPSIKSIMATAVLENFKLDMHTKDKEPAVNFFMGMLDVRASAERDSLLERVRPVPRRAKKAATQINKAGKTYALRSFETPEPDDANISLEINPSVICTVHYPNTSVSKRMRLVDALPEYDSQIKKLLSDNSDTLVPDCRLLRQLQSNENPLPPAPQ